MDNRRNKIKYWSLVSANLLLALADGGLTYWNTPDLTMEANPLVSKLGLGWGALGTVNIVILGLLFWLAYYSFFQYKTVYTKETKFTAYISQIVYGRPDKFWTGLIPKHIAPYMGALGPSLLWGCIGARIVVIFEWLCITFGWRYRYDWTMAYFRFRKVYCFGRPDVIVAVVIGYICFFAWFYREFQKQKQEQPHDLS